MSTTGLANSVPSMTKHPATRTARERLRTLAPKTKARSTFEKTAKQFAKKAAGAKLRKTR